MNITWIIIIINIDIHLSLSRFSVTSSFHFHLTFCGYSHFPSGGVSPLIYFLIFLFFLFLFQFSFLISRTLVVFNHSKKIHNRDGIPKITET